MKIKNWQKFQHYKQRNPPWIKLHKTILEDRASSMLADRTFRVLIGLWLLASEDEKMEGNLPPVDEIAFRLRVEKPKLIKCLEELQAFVYSDASVELAECKQSSMPETETEAEAEGEGEAHFSRFWEVFPKKVGKAKARVAFVKLGPTSSELEGILKALDTQIASESWKEQNGKFIPHAATWLNGRRWEDEISKPWSIDDWVPPEERCTDES